MKKQKTKSLLSRVILVMSVALISSIGLLYIPTFLKFRFLLKENENNKLKFLALKISKHLKKKLLQKSIQKINLARICDQEKIENLGIAILEKNSNLIFSLGFPRKDLEEIFIPLSKKQLHVFPVGAKQSVWVSLDPKYILLVGFPKRADLQFYSYSFFLAILMIASLFIAGGVMIYALYRIVLKPLEDLIVANLGTIEGRPEYLLIPEIQIPNNEIGDTMRHRNRLIVKLKEFQQRIGIQNEELRTNQKELQNWSRELEARVESKTIELKRAEEHLVKAKHLAALGQLASGVAHEVNNPLASIAGYAEDMIETLKLKQSFSKEETNEFIESLQIIEDQSYRLKDLTRKLLNFARQTDLQVDEVEVNHLIKETISLVALKSPKTAPIATKFSSEIPIFKTDRSKLQQVLMNLLDNALDAVKEKGEIQVLTRRNQNWVQIMVQDTGKGILPKIQERIFEPFFTTKPVGSGTGLGLSICYGIVKKLRGTLEVESLPKKGTVFVVNLPIDH